MKILLNCHLPFLLAHGGMQIQIEQTKAALEKIGVQTEYLRWFDGDQTGDLMHFFGRPPAGLLRLAHQRGMKVVISDLLTGQGSRPLRRLQFQGVTVGTLKTLLPRRVTDAFGWNGFQIADACVALTTWEAKLTNLLFHAPMERIHVVPNGVEEVFLQARSAERGKWLVCTATITERKRVLELAEAAVQAQKPVWIIGKPYSDSDPYAQRVLALAKKNSQFIRYEGAISDRARMAEIYREARGFVLLSTMESLSLSALEAAACECPLLLSELPWARTVFNESVSYCPITPDVLRTASVLEHFYDAAPNLKPPAKPLTWTEVAGQLKTVYESVLKMSR